MVCPGFIDTHVHGAMGASFGSDKVEDIRDICQYRAQTGTTGLLATVATTSWEKTLAALRAICAAMSNTGGSAILGIHLEGPYVNPARKGAMNPALMRRPSLAEAKQLQEAANGQIALMTVAPELEGGLDLVAHLAREGIIPSIGHSDATREQVAAAVRCGVRHATHTFNAMRPLHHRDPGTVGGILLEEGIVAELIGDGAHVDPAAGKVLVAAKGWERVMLVTDGVSLAGLPPGRYERNGRGYILREVLGTYEDGTIAGSASPMNRNVQVYAQEAKVPLPQVLAMASTVPARQLGLGHRKGMVRPAWMPTSS